MPDYKRLCGPTDSVPYSQFQQKSDQGDENCILKKRKDDRKNGQHRLIFTKTRTVTQAKGSAYIEQGNTKVVCSVFDPREIPRKSEYSLNGELYCELKFASFSCFRRRGLQPDQEEKELSLNLKRALEPVVCRHEFPNFQVDVYALVLENDGSSLAAAITCAGLALADAGVPIYDIVTGISIGIYDNKQLVDPTLEEENICLRYQALNSEKSNYGMITLAYMHTHEQISEFIQIGSVDSECVMKATNSMTEACELIYPLLQDCLIKSVEKTIKKKEIDKS